MLAFWISFSICNLNILILATFSRVFFRNKYCTGSIQCRWKFHFSCLAWLSFITSSCPQNKKVGRFLDLKVTFFIHLSILEWWTYPFLSLKFPNAWCFSVEEKCHHFFTNMDPLGHYHIWFCGGIWFSQPCPTNLVCYLSSFEKSGFFEDFPSANFLPRKQMCLCWCGNLRPKIKVFRTVSFMQNAIFPSWQISWEFPASSSFVIISFRFLHTLSQILQINKQRKPCSSHGACAICPKCLSVSISIFFLFYSQVLEKGLLPQFMCNIN